MAAAVALVVALAGCELRTEINIDVADDGSGTVQVGAGVDDDALERRPDLLDDLALDDLLATGWTATEPAKEADGLTWVRLTHDFARPEDVGILVDEIAGEHGPFRDFAVVRDDGFAETSYTFSGTVDFSAGVSGLTDDPELAEALEADPAELIEDEIGQAIDDVLQVQIGVRLPGDVVSNAPTQASNGALWRPSVLERDAVDLSATGTLQRTERYLWLALAVAAGFALLFFLAIRLAAWRRRTGQDPAPDA
ncbi:hypothetical protein [Actinospongicola halichondriae]|uniref:hypothetical protein n=1 Tax=Actinospongicola halichondriae TaxID=3236844 RepID=UPI003D3AA26F